MTRAIDARWSALAATTLFVAIAGTAFADDNLPTPDSERKPTPVAQDKSAPVAEDTPVDEDKSTPVTDGTLTPVAETDPKLNAEPPAALTAEGLAAPAQPETLAARPRQSTDLSKGAPLPPAPLDINAFPSGATGPELRPLGVELHGFAALWWIPWSQEAPGAATDALRLRFAVLRIDARPAPKVTVLARLGLMLPGSPLLDMAATYQLHNAVGFTFGQFRLPLGASATTLAPQLVMLDRSRYVYAMTKLAFRDVGAMVNSGPAGLADGLIHYRLAVASGSGRLGSGIERSPRATQYLIAGRVFVDVPRWILGRVVAGLSYARSRDPAIDSGMPAADRALAVNTLGRTLVPFGDKRVTHLAGADLTLMRGPIWAQAETLYLRSRATDGAAQAKALGISLEAGYTLPIELPLALQLAARGERFDPNLDADADAQNIVSLGLNATTARVRWSAFASAIRFEYAATRMSQHAGELAFRAAAAF